MLTSQVSREEKLEVNPNVNTTTSRIRDFTRMNLPSFYDSFAEEDPQGLIDKVFKVLDAMLFLLNKRQNYPPTSSQIWLMFCMKDGRIRG